MDIKLHSFSYFTLALCPSISPPGFGRFVTGSEEKQPAGKNVTFACDLDLELVGSATITCQDDGTWNSSPPECAEGSLILVLLD